MVRTVSTMLPLGTKAPEFSLPDFEGRLFGLQQSRGKAGLLIIFMCNHCPYVKHVAGQLVKIADEYTSRGIGVVGISSNDIASHPEDAPDKMREEARIQGYRFPYLYDESQAVAKAYRAACTPDFYLFDSNLSLVYRGQMDDSRPKQDSVATGADLRSALDALLAGQAISEPQKPSVGCNIKWKPGNEPVYFGPSA